MDDTQYNRLKNTYDKGKGRYVVVHGVLGIGLTFAILISLMIPLVDSSISFGLLFQMMVFPSLFVGTLVGIYEWSSVIEKKYLPVKRRKDEEAAATQKEKAEEEERKKTAEAAQKAEEERKKELIKKYGEEFGLAVFKKKVYKGMSLAMVEDAIGKHKYKDGNDYYFGKPFKRKIVFKKGELIEDKTFKDRLWLDMPKDMLIASWGNPGDKKESVTKSSVKQRLFFNGRENRQGGTSYEYQVDLENDLVVGWKELE